MQDNLRGGESRFLGLSLCIIGGVGIDFVLGSHPELRHESGMVDSVPEDHRNKAIIACG